MFDALKKREPKLIDMELYHRSAVVVPLVEKNGDYQVLFEVRSKGLKRQPGEICFPGGGCETGEAKITKGYRLPAGSGSASGNLRGAFDFRIPD